MGVEDCGADMEAPQPWDHNRLAILGEQNRTTLQMAQGQNSGAI